MTAASRRTAWLLAAICGWHLLLSLNALRLPLMTDEGEYAYAARVWSSGGLPYRDAYLQKPPLIVGVYRLAQAFSDEPRAPRILALLAVWATCGLLFAAAPRRWSSAARLAPGAVYASASALPIGDHAFPANTEVFVALFSAAALLFMTRFVERGRSRRDAVFCGLALGAALTAKQTAVWTLLGFAALLAWRPGKRLDARAPFACLAGAAVVPALWAAYFFSRGGLGDMIDQIWTRNRLYGALIASPEAFSFHWDWFVSSVARPFAWGLWPAAALALYGCNQDFSRERLGEAAAVVWLGAALTGAATGLFFFPHYFQQAAPALAAVAGLGVQKLAERGPGRARAAAGAAALASFWPAAAFAAPFFRDDGHALAKRLLWPNPLYEARAIGSYARLRSSPKDFLYVFGSEAQIYEYARRRCATPHEVVYALTMFPKDRSDIDGELALLDEARPKVVVYSAQPFSAIIGSRLGAEFRDRIRERLARGYVWSGQVKIAADGGWSVFGAEPFRGKKPDWDDEESLFIFERR